MTDLSKYKFDTSKYIVLNSSVHMIAVKEHKRLLTIEKLWNKQQIKLEVERLKRKRK